MEKKAAIMEKPTAKEIKAMLIPGKPLEKANEDLIRAMDEASGKIAYVAIRTMYDKAPTDLIPGTTWNKEVKAKLSGNEFLLKLLYGSSLCYARENNKRYREEIASKKGFSHDEEVKPRKKEKRTFIDPPKNSFYNSDSKYTEEQVKLLSMDEEALFEKALQSIENGEDDRGKLANLFLETWEAKEAEAEADIDLGSEKSFYVPLKPRKGKKTSEQGKLYDLETKYEVTSPNNEFQDIKQECFLAIWEVYASGLIQDASDIWIYSKYYYSKVNSLVRKNKKVFNQNQIYTVITSGEDKNGSYYEKLLTDRKAEKAFAKIDSEEVFEKLNEFLVNSLDKRSNKEAVSSVFYLLFLGYKQVRIAEKLEVSEMMVSKYIRQIRKALSTAEAKEIISAFVSEAV